MSADGLLDERWELIWKAEYSSRYHRRRAAFLSNTDTFINVINVMAGASAFGALLAEAPTMLSKFGTAIVVLLSLLQILLRLGANSAAHAQWLGRWTTLLAELRSKTAPTEIDLEKWFHESAMIESQCVGELRALCYACENAAARALGVPDREVEIKWWQRLIMHLVTIQSSFPRVRQPRECHNSSVNQ